MRNDLFSREGIALFYQSKRKSEKKIEGRLPGRPDNS